MSPLARSARQLIGARVRADGETRKSRCILASVTVTATVTGSAGYEPEDPLQDWRQLGTVARDDAARILGSSSKSIDKLCKEGALQARHAGRRVLITVHSIRCYLGELRAEGWIEPARLPERPSLPVIRDQRIVEEARRGVSGSSEVERAALPRHHVA
jgi:hypothetical protein